MGTELQAARILDGRFEIAEPPSGSDVGAVIRATDLTTGASVAVNMLVDVEDDPAFLSRLLLEIQAARRLDHPGILKILAGGDMSHPYFVTECVEGETLQARLLRVGPLPVDEARRIAMLLCDALDYMHRRDVVHRNLTPANVMLGRDGSVRIAMDFGLAMAGAVGRRTFAGPFWRRGAPHYMAPEQARGRRSDARADVYGLGALLYEMTTGHAPYDEQPNLCAVMNARLIGDPVAPRVHNRNIAPAVEEIILHALARGDDRYPSAAAVQSDLAAPDRVTVTGRAGSLTVPSFVQP